MDDELLEQIAQAPVEQEPELLRVLADQLILRGDPLGELIVVAGDRLRLDTPELRRREEALIAEREAQLRRTLARPRTTFHWRRGLLDRVGFSQVGDPPLELALAQLAGCPEARLLRRIEIRALAYDGEGNLGPAFATLATLAPRWPRLVELVVERDLDAGNPWVDGPIEIGDVSPLYAAYPTLEILALDGLRIELRTIVLPALRRLAASNLVVEDARRIVAAELPRLVELDLHFAYRSLDNVAASFGPLLHRSFPHLEALALALPTIPAQEWLVAELPAAPIAHRIRRLSFTRGQMVVGVLEQLLADRARYPYLERLELNAHSLSATLQRRLARAFGSALALV